MWLDKIGAVTLDQGGNDMATFAEKLKQLREKAGMSQGELAERAGLTRQAVSRLEGADNEPGWRTVQRLARALGLDCRAFEDADIVMPTVEPKKPPGRPRKDSTSSAEPVADPVDTLPAEEKKQARKRKGTS